MQRTHNGQPGERCHDWPRVAEEDGAQEVFGRDRAWVSSYCPEQEETIDALAEALGVCTGEVLMRINRIGLEIAAALVLGQGSSNLASLVGHLRRRAPLG